MANYSRTANSLGSSIGAFFGGGDRALKAGEMAGLQKVALQDQIEQRRAAAARDAAEGSLKTPDAITQRVLMGLGVPTDLAPQAQEFQRTGKIGAWSPDIPANAGVGAPTLPRGLTADILNRFGRDAQAEQRVLAGSAKSLEDAFSAPGAAARSDLDTEIAKGFLPPEVGGARVAAIQGKPLYNVDSNGAVLDLFGGGLNESSQLARSAIGLRGAQTAAQRANAAQSYASADNSRASAAQTRAEMAAGVAGGAGAKAPAGYRWTSQGGMEPIPGGPADPATKGAKLAKPPTEGQAKALMFGSRMAISDEVLAELDQQGIRTPNYVKQAAETVPFIGGALGMGANGLGSSGEQQVEQAQRDFINAVLRRESGAAIGKDEFSNATKQYFPQPGDSPEVRQQKAANRRTAISGMKAEFGEQAVPEFESIIRSARSARQPVRPAPAPPRPSSPTAATEPVPVTTDADYLNLAPGTRFRAPDGTIRVKP